MDLSQFDAKRFAVVMKVNGAVHVFRGAARYEPDSSWGAVLKISSAADENCDSGNPVFVLHQDTWDGSLSGDDRYGCDFRLDLDLLGTATAGLQAAG